jgi:hypothetical protein
MGNVFSFPTFMPDEEQARQIDITALNTDASIDSLRKNDPFMYFSIFKPTGNHQMEAANHVAELQSGDGPSESVMVERKRRISVECDLLTATQEMLGLGGDNAEADQVMLDDNDDDNAAGVFEHLHRFEAQ